MTAVLHQQDGEWKAIQTHASIGVRNDGMLDAMFGAGAEAPRSARAWYVEFGGDSTVSVLMPSAGR